MTDYFLLVDSDMVVSKDFRSRFLKFAAKFGRSSEKLAYVLPVFETRSPLLIPRTKQELVASWERGESRPFYEEACRRCQENTDYASWKEGKTDDGAMTLMYELTWRDPWEPFYVGDTNAVPVYDERFRQYGFNRISQVCCLDS